MCNDFTHLHCHSDASPDGLGPIDRMVERAVELGYDALALTDHGTLGRTISFASECNANGIKPIIGLEPYLWWNGNRHHLTLNATTHQGFENLVAISNAAHENYTSGYPLMTVDMLGAHDLSGISMFSGCPASALHVGTDADAAHWLGTMVDLFGKENVYAEVMFVMTEDFTSRPVRLAKQFGLKTVVTGDVHFSHESMVPSHRILTSCRKGFSYDSSNLWLKSPDEIWAAGNRLYDGVEVKEWMQNTYDFSQMIEPIIVSDEAKLPDCTAMLPEFMDKLEAAFKKDIAGKEDSAEREARYAFELSTLTTMKFMDYFLVLNDIIDFCHRESIILGPGRGSAAGSYLLYLLQITALDPIEHKLYFERFINPHRVGLPDVDVDIESNRRQEVIDYANERWEGVPVAAYSHYSHKVTVNDISRNLKIDRKVSSEAGEAGPDSKAMEEWSAKHKHARPTYDAMIGQMRHASKHAGGIVITDGAVPIEMIGGNLVAAWTEGSKKELSKAGIIKFDLLGLTALSQIDEMRKITGLRGDHLPADNEAMFDIFCDGDVAGIFQWSGSDGIRQLTQRIAPRTFTDLVVINSLYRPGALDAGTADLYPELKGAHRLIDPRIDKILEETRGVIVFQEQVMEIFAEVVGITFAEADLARRAIFKVQLDNPKWVKQIEELQATFYDKGVANGFDKRRLEKLWSEIFTHTRYSFNRAHSAAYALVATEMAWFKKHHPLAFYTAALNYDMANAQSYVLEAAQKGVRLLPPHVNQPTSRFTPTPDGKAIRMPLSLVKYLSAKSADLIIEEFDTNGEFADKKDFVTRVKGRTCTARARKNLYALGAFDGLSGSSEVLFTLKDDEPILNKVELQLAALDFVIPNKATADYIARRTALNDERLVVGFIRDWSKRTNKRGKRYNVYYCSPYGTFWLDDNLDKLKKGDLVEVQKNHFGKAMKRKILTIEGDE